MSFTIARALAEARALGLARLDAQLLLAHHLQCSRTWLIAHDDAELDTTQADGKSRWRHNGVDDFELGARSVVLLRDTAP